MLIYKWKSIDAANKILLFYVCLSSINEYALRIFIALFHFNIPLINGFTLLEFILLLTYFWKNYHFNDRFFYSLLILISIIIFVWESSFSGFREISVYTIIYCNSVMTLLALLSFTYMIKRVTESFLVSKAEFWSSIAILIFFSGTLFNFGMKKITGRSLLTQQISSLTLFAINILYYFLLSYGIWKSSKTEK